MCRSNSAWTFMAAVCICGIVLIADKECLGQGIGGAGGGAGGTAGGAGGTGGGAGGSSAGGIIVDPDGVVRAVFAKEKSGKLARKRDQAGAQSSKSSDETVYSPQRMVSLVRLEAECRKFAAEKTDATPVMQFLAGLQRIDYVFVFPESQDLVIAGPAEGFVVDATGRTVGRTTGRPPLRLDDLIVALRSVQRAGSLGCSIDPREEGLARFNAFVNENSFPTTLDETIARYPEMAKRLGMQDVRIWGVPAESHFGNVLVEADYRMKLISLGLERPRLKSLRSHLSMIPPGGNSTQRWWFAPLYDPFVKSEDGLAFRISGPRAQLLAQEELIEQGGKRTAAGGTRQTTQKWAKHFTEKFPELAKVSPVFAELQNLFDLAVVAALIKKERLSDKVDWKMQLFLDEKQAAVSRWNVPRQVETVANYRVSDGSLVIGLTGGGVEIDPLRTANSIHYRADADGKLKAALENAGAQNPPAEHPWWWD